MLQNFERLAMEMPTQALLEAIDRKPDLWSEITARQTTPGSAHRYTEAIFLRWPKALTVEAAFTDITAIDYPALERLPEARPLISRLVRLVGGTELGRVLVVALAPGGHIDPHPDEGAAADHYERFHVALSSEAGNEFHSMRPDGVTEMVHMQPGELWWFNHKRVHWLQNKSKSPRIHLIADVVAPKYRRERD